MEGATGQTTTKGDSLVFLKTVYYWSIVGLPCCVKFLLYSEVHALYKYPLFFGLPSHSGCHRRLSQELPVVDSRFSLVIWFMQSSGYMSIPTSKFIPLLLSHLGVHTFFLSVSLFLLCKQVHLYHISRVHMYINIQYYTLELITYT